MGNYISIAGLVLAPLTTLFARHYSRTLYFAQFLSILAALNVINSGGVIIVSNYLRYTELDFDLSNDFTNEWCTAISPAPMAN